MLLPLPPSLVLVSLLLGWAEAFVCPAAHGIFAPQRQNGDTAPPPARRPSLRSPQSCARLNEDSSHRRERSSLALRSNQNDDQTETSNSAKNFTQIDDGSPLGVAIVVLGGSWVAFADGQDMTQLPFSLIGGVVGGYGGGGDDDVRIWAVFATASVAAGISRLIRYYWDKKNGE